MARFVVTTKRALRGAVRSAVDAVGSKPGVTVLSCDDPDMVMIEASAETAQQLRNSLSDTHFVEPEVRRGLHEG